ncbi:MAG TPA: class I tRNA ligase family protein, partial [Spirillospora sp.]|nr:class I tRNA ligase family protein [Spirillospora sp.]
MVNSGQFDGAFSSEAKGRKNPAINAVIEWLEQQGIGKEAVNYRLRDWLISRQRYWGSPIPIIYRQDGTIETVPDEDLPVLLPEDVEFMPSGRSPLTYHEPFLNTVDSQGNPARRETDTLDTFMCSSWYWYRYLSPHYDKGPFDPEEAAYWLPVDTYTGGAEHATMHLLYSRWFTKAMRDLGMFDETIRIMKAHGRDPEPMLWGEPMLQYRAQGQVLGAERMGDMLIVTGRKVSATKLIAETIKVIENASDLAQAGDQDTVFYGELMRRTENLLTVQNPAGEVMIVEVPDTAVIEIPAIPGPNTVNQLKQHLEIQRMSKSKGNVVNPDELVQTYGTDTVRAYLMFAFDWQKGGPWDPDGIKGPQRWLNEVWEIVTAGPPTETGDPDTERHIERKLHQTIARVSESLEKFSFNTAIAALMALKNELRPAARDGKIGRDAWRETVQTMLVLMAPFTPHIAEELWVNHLGCSYSIHNQPWPQYDAEKAKEDTVALVVMVNGRPRGEAQVPADIGEAEAIEVALATEAAQRYLNGGKPKKVIFIPGRGGQEPKVNIVV